MTQCEEPGYFIDSDPDTVFFNDVIGSGTPQKDEQALAACPLLQWST